jgi:hypothetical protein
MKSDHDNLRNLILDWDDDWDDDEWNSDNWGQFPEMNPQSIEDTGVQHEYTVFWRGHDSLTQKWSRRPPGEFSQGTRIMASTPRLAAMKNAVRSEHSSGCTLAVVGYSDFSSSIYHSNETGVTLWKITLCDAAEADFRGPVLKFDHHYRLDPA